MRTNDTLGYSDTSRPAQVDAFNEAQANLTYNATNSIVNRTDPEGYEVKYFQTFELWPF